MTHNEKVLALLSDGQPYSHREMYGLFVMAHSRVADLRKRGHDIRCWREGDLYFYRLLGEAESKDAGHETAREPLSRTALRFSEQVALPAAGKPPSTAACSPLQLTLGSASGDGAPYASSESRAA